MAFEISGFYGFLIASVVYLAVMLVVNRKRPAEQ